MPHPESRHRHLAAAAAIVALAAAVGLTVWFWQQDRDAAAPTADAAAPEPTCGPVLREPAGGSGDHIDGAPVAYASAPPSFGDHRSRWEIMAETFYDADDRPDVAVLVHNLEHGYNILWYDQTVLDDADAREQVRQIAAEYTSFGRARDPATAFIAAPWTDQDGGDFPAGMTYALTHWYADPTDRTRSRDDEMGLTRYCDGISAEIVQQWMDDFPLADAPEGYPDLM